MQLGEKKKVSPLLHNDLLHVSHTSLLLSTHTCSQFHRLSCITVTIFISYLYTLTSKCLITSGNLTLLSIAFILQLLICKVTAN